jgi:hypothetical protein
MVARPHPVVDHVYKHFEDEFGSENADFPRLRAIAAAVPGLRVPSFRRQRFWYNLVDYVSLRFMRASKQHEKACWKQARFHRGHISRGV